MMRSEPSGEMLEGLGEAGIPVVVIHGDRDMPVPYATAVDAARRSSGTLVTVKGGTHSWVLKDPETLPAIIAELLDGPLARVRGRGARGRGPAVRRHPRADRVGVPRAARLGPAPDPAARAADRHRAPPGGPLRVDGRATRMTARRAGIAAQRALLVP